MQTEPWDVPIRRRLRRTRVERELSFVQVRNRANVAPGSLLKIEGGSSQNLHLDVLVPLAKLYDVPLLDLVFGWPEALPAPRGPSPSIGPLQQHVRYCIRRDRGERGTPSVAALVGMTQSTLVRWESGEYERIDLIRLHALADVLGASLREWLTPIF